MKKKLLIVTSLLTVVLFAACGQKQESDTEQKGAGWKKGDEVVIGIDDSFVPMGFRDENDQIVGFDIDLAQKVFENEGIKYKLQPIDWSMKETELKNGTIDVIWNGYSVTPEREKVVAFSDPYLKNKQVLVSLEKNNIDSFADMKGKKLGVQEGSSGESAVLENPEVLLDLIDNQEPTAYDTFTNAFLDLKSGRIDGLIIDQVFADYYISHDGKDTKYTITEGDLPEEDFAIGLRPNDTELLEIINTGLKDSYEKNQSQAVSQTWFGEDRIVKPK